METSIGMVPVVDTKGVPWLMWIPSGNEISENALAQPVQFDGLRVVAFHHFAGHFNELNKWLSLIDKLALEYVGRIKFAAQDIKTVESFHKTLNSEDFGSYRPDVPPRLYGMDKNGCIYTMHMFFCYKYIKDFCENLLQNKMFQALVVNPLPELDLPPRNFYDIESEINKDIFIMFYDPVCYFWKLQLGMLRKLAKLLENEDIIVVAVDKSHNYLGIDVDKWTNLDSYHGAIAISTKRINGYDPKFRSRHDSSRGYLRYIAQRRNPELKEYDREGEPRISDQFLSDIRYLYDAERF